MSGNAAGCPAKQGMEDGQEQGPAAGCGTMEKSVASLNDESVTGYQLTRKQLVTMNKSMAMESLN